MARPSRTHPASRVVPVALAAILGLIGCDGKSPLEKKAYAANAPAPRSSRVVACALMPKEEINAITGETYTKGDSQDDGRSSGTTCVYATETNPAGMTLEVQWINAEDYSDAAEHAALQSASVGGAKLAGKLVGGTISGGIAGMPSGPIADVGDEATLNLTLLTARKGDYTVMVQIIPSNMMAFLRDSTVAIALLEKEKAVARKALAKL